MSITLATVLLTPGQAQTISLLGPSAPLALKVSNKSPYDVQYSGFGVIGSDWIPSGTEYMLYAVVQSTGELILTAFNNANVSPANPGAVLISEYVIGEQLPVGHWPVSIPFQTVNASTNVTTSQYLKDDIDPAGTQFIESSVSGKQATLVTTDGLWTLSAIIAGALHQFLKTNAAGNLLQLGNANDTVEILNGLVMNNNVVFPISAGLAWTNGAGGSFLAGLNNSGATLVYNSSGSVHQFLMGGNALGYTLDNTGFKLTSGKQIVFGSGHEITDCYGMTGTGSGTFGTGAPNNNLFPAFDPCTASGSSQTIGGTRAASMVVTTGAGLAWSATIVTF